MIAVRIAFFVCLPKSPSPYPSPKRERESTLLSLDGSTIRQTHGAKRSRSTSSAQVEGNKREGDDSVVTRFIRRLF